MGLCRTPEKLVSEKHKAALLAAVEVGELDCAVAEQRWEALEKFSRSSQPTLVFEVRQPLENHVKTCREADQGRCHCLARCSRVQAGKGLIHQLPRRSNWLKTSGARLHRLVL